MKTGLNKQCTKGRRVSSEQNNSELRNAELSSTSDDNVERINHSTFVRFGKKKFCKDNI